MAHPKHTHARFLGMLSLIGSLTLAACGGGTASVYNPPEASYPIVIERKLHSIKIPVEGDRITSSQERRLARTAQLYKMHGESDITIASPENIDARLKVNQIIAVLHSHGISMDYMVTGTYNSFSAPEAETSNLVYDSHEGNKIFVSFHRTAAMTNSCDDMWALDTTRSSHNNAQSRGFGCALQNNLAAMLEDPNDIIAPRPAAQIDAENRGRVFDAFIAGEDTFTQPLEGQNTQAAGN